LNKLDPDHIKTFENANMLDETRLSVAAKKTFGRHLPDSFAKLRFLTIKKNHR